MGFLDEIRKKNKLAKSLVSNGLAPNFDVAVKMVEARMRVESGAQDPIESSKKANASQNVTSVISNTGEHIAQLQRDSAGQFDADNVIPKNIGVNIPTEYAHATPETRNTPQPQQQTQQREQQTVQGAQQGLTQRDIERILSENTKFITEQLVEFKTQLSSLTASMENMQQELNQVKHSQRILNQKGASSAPSETKSEDSKKAHPREPSKDSNFKAEDVAIEKMFNFSNKKF